MTVSPHDCREALLAFPVALPGQPGDHDCQRMRRSESRMETHPSTTMADTVGTDSACAPYAMEPSVFTTAVWLAVFRCRTAKQAGASVEYVAQSRRAASGTSVSLER